MQSALDDPDLDDEARELISRYVLEPAGLSHHEDAPDLWDESTPNDDLPF